jgi:chemotaxis protein methyltransferase CheR
MALPVEIPGTETGDELEDVELELLLTGLARRYGYDFRDYAPASLRRRVRRAVAREGLRNISALQERLLREPAAMRRFVANLSVGVTAMFRDPEFYREFRQHVVPLLRTYPFVRIWDAGCATGEEVYSLAIVLEEEGLYGRCRIYATDLSDALLEQARKGMFPLDSMQTYTANYLKAGGTREFSSYYIADSENAMFRESLRGNIVFSQHNLVSDGSFNEFNVILCRNVMIYFNQALRDRVHGLLHESLGMFGVLGVGRKENLRFTPHADCYEALPGDVGLYRRIR